MMTTKTKTPTSGMELLIVYADGLDASMDGRGYTAEHEAARQRIVLCCDSHDEMLKALLGIIHHNNALKESAKISPALIAHVERTIAKATTPAWVKP